jgi:DNA (cytosine-5)-methyltransferase 1
MYTIHLFAGAGGGILADLLLGHTPIAACEIEPYPRRVLIQRQLDGILPVFPVWDDVRTLRIDNPECTGAFATWRAVRDNLAICGGFPCQDISAAGKGAGIAGKRSGLWSEFARIIREIRPRNVFVENSPMLTGRGLGVVLGDLAAMGYDALWGCVGAEHAIAHSGDRCADHERDRIWILAAMAHANRVRELQPQRSEQKQRVRAGDTGSTIPNTDSLHEQGEFTGSVEAQGWHEPRGGSPGSQCDGISWWSTEPRVGRVVDGMAYRSHRLSAIGNGQVPACAAMAWRILQT